MIPSGSQAGGSVQEGDSVLCRFLYAVQLYCIRTGASVTSWQRTKKHNHEIGGVETSRHLLGLAVDVVYDAVQDPAHTLQLADELGLHIYREADHDHLEPKPGGDS